MESGIFDMLRDLAAIVETTGWQTRLIKNRLPKVPSVTPIFEKYLPTLDHSEYPLAQDICNVIHSHKNKAAFPLIVVKNELCFIASEGWISLLQLFFKGHDLHVDGMNYAAQD